MDMDTVIRPRPAGKHLQDLGALHPRHDELIAAARWTREHNPLITKDFLRSPLSDSNRQPPHYK